MTTIERRRPTCDSARRMRIAIESRLVGQYYNEENIGEYLNSLFPVVESIRTEIREMDPTAGRRALRGGLHVDPIALEDRALELIRDTLRFLERWHLSYAYWMQEAKKEYRKEFSGGDECAFYALQNHHPRIGAISQDVVLMNNELASFAKEMRQCESVGSLIDRIKCLLGLSKDVFDSKR
jgi:hypothetical protein